MGDFFTLTAFPASTHLRHGRAGSHPRCFFLQLTQADATWAFVRRVDFCASDRPVGCVGSNVGAPASNGDPAYTGPCSLYPRDSGSLTGICDSSNTGTADRSVNPREGGYPRGISADSSEGFAGGDPDIDWWGIGARGLHPRALGVQDRFNGSRSGPWLNRGCPNWDIVRLGG